MLTLAALLCSTAALALRLQPGAAESLDFSRVHIVDVNQATDQILFRSNFPSNATGAYDYPLLMSYLQNRTEQANLTWPSDPYLVVMSLNNPAEPEYWIEQAWWKDNAWAGELIQYVQGTRRPPGLGAHARMRAQQARTLPATGSACIPRWPLLGAYLPPADYPNATRKAMVENASFWEIDQLPDRLAAARTTLATPRSDGRTVVALWHCTAGRDRTGEISGSYYMTYEGLSGAQAFARDTQEGGRAPNYWAHTALQWYCFWLSVHQPATASRLGDCLTM